MHFVYLHQHFVSPKGSGGIRSYQMARAAVDTGHKVTMICGSYQGGDTGLSGPYIRGRRTGNVDGIEVIEFDLKYSNSDGFLRRCMTFARFAFSTIWLAMTMKYDLIFATSTPLTAGIPGIFAAVFRRKPFVFEVRDLWPELPREMGVIKNPVVLGALSALEWCAYRTATRIVALSPGIARGIERRGVNREQIALIPNGCDIEIFGDENIEPWRPEGIPKQDLLAIFTGTHGLANGLDAVLDAAIELKRRNRNDIKVVLIGDGRLKSALIKRAESESLTNVIFMDPVPKARLAQLMTSADLGLQCLANVEAFYYGTSPNKFFDYIAAGLPVLNNYPGWLADMIKEQNCGFAIGPDNPVEFADALEKAADNRSSLNVMGKNSHDLAHREFNRTELAIKWTAWVIEGIKK